MVAEGRGYGRAGGVTLNAESLNALNASRQVIGGQFSVLYGQGGNYITPQRVSRSVALREGATLSALGYSSWPTAAELLVEQAQPSTPSDGARALTMPVMVLSYNLNVTFQNYGLLATSNELAQVYWPLCQAPPAQSTSVDAA